MEARDIINIDPEIMGGTPVFRGTRVPLQSLFWNLEDGVSLDEFLEDFPSVSREQAEGLLELFGQTLTSENIKTYYQLDEITA